MNQSKFIMVNILMKVLLKMFSFIILMSIPLFTQAQCAMCRTQVVNNVSHGETSLAAGLNFGIMYLFFAPYLILGLIAYFWYKKSRVNVRPRSILERIKG